MKISYGLRMGILLLCLTLLTACDLGGALPVGNSDDPSRQYEAPPFHNAQFDPAQAEEFDTFAVDRSSLAEGYVAIRAQSENRLKLLLTKDEQQYAFNLSNQDEPEVFPLTMGDGSYQIQLAENVADTKYAVVWSDTLEVALDDSFEPFLRPSQYVHYNENSQCVSKAKSLAQGCAVDLDVVSAVYDYIVSNVTYDNEKAKTVQSGYLPDPDETLQTGQGICFDYACLAASMLRSQGIPCKLITGYVGDELFHAWNEVYIQNEGWIAIGISADGSSWSRVDTTFAASGVSAEELTDDSRYTVSYIY